MKISEYKRIVSLYYDDPVRFIEDIIMFEEKPDEENNFKLLKIGKQQQKVVENCVKAINTRKSISVKSGHGTGKTCISSLIALWYLTTRRNSRGMVVAPTEKQSKFGLWNELKFWINNSPILSEFLVWSAETIQVKGLGNDFGNTGGWQLELRTASCQDNVSGLHGKGGSLVIVDEASGITDEGIWAALEGATTDKGSLMLLIGNPTQLYGKFYDSFHTQRDDFINITLSAESVDYRGDKRLIKKWLKTHGRDSDWYRVRALGEFPKSEADGYISISELSSCYNRPKDASIYFPIISIDPADDGNDTTEICAGVGKNIYFWKTISGKTDGIKNITAIIEAANYLRSNAVEFCFPDHLPIEVIIDVTGIGASTRDMIKTHERKYNLTLVENKASWKGDETTESMKDLLWSKMKFLLKDISIPYNTFEEKHMNDINQLTRREFFDKMEEQICSRKYTIPNGKILLESKQQLRKRGLKSPNIGDALSLYCYQLSSHMAYRQAACNSNIRITLNYNRNGWV